MPRGHKAQRAWPERLEDLFRRLRLPVAVHNLAQGGTTSKWALANMRALEGQLLKADVILVDYGINDLAQNSDFRPEEGSGEAAVKTFYRDLLQALLGLPQRPAVVDIETFLEPASGLSLVRSAAPLWNCAQGNVTEYLHWSVNKELQVPTLSYADAVCHTGRTFWMREGQNVDEDGLQHPGSLTHDILARIVRGALLVEMDAVCQDGAGGMDHPQDLVDKVGNHTKCLANPSTFYQSLGGQAAFVPVSHDHHVWTFREDVPGKPGWIAGTTHRGGDISFSVETRSGWIQVEFLGTYENIGYVTVWLDDEAPAEVDSCTLDGFWPERTSQSRFALLRTGLAPGRHTLKLRSHGAKFKLLGVASC